MTTETQKQEQITQAIRENGTPLYIYDLDIVRTNFERLEAAIPYLNKRIYYAMMANNNRKILETITKLGGCVQINSLHELESLKRIFISEGGFISWRGFRNDRVSFTSTGLSSETLDTLVQNGVQTNLDSVEEVEKFCKTFYSSYFGIRLKMPEVTCNGGFKRSSDTGIREEDLELVQVNARNHGKIINGVHGYCGTNIFDVNFFKKSADYVVKCAEQFPDLAYVNFGGGFGVAVNRHLKPINLEDVLSHYSELTARLSEKLGRLVQLRIEPGRALVADAGTLYTKITNVKSLRTNNLEGKDQVSVDCGFGEFARPRIYGTFHDIFALGKEGNTRYCDVRANTVLDDDYLIRDTKLPEVYEGDILGIRNVGAYGRVMASGFPGKDIPKEVCI